ncbi:glycoside hydrolase family 3 domain protein [Botrytis cinerea]
MSESPDSQISDPIFDRFEEGSDILSSRDTIATPNSEMTPPESPVEKHAILDPRTKSRQLAASLSLEEQVSLLVAADFWRSKSIPSKGVPAFKTSDGPNGARGAIFKAGTKAALFPCGISLAATWNTDLIHEVGQHLADETKARSAQVLLAPTVCLHRGPLGGRNFESFSEDPYLTGKLAIAYIKGLQEKGIAATIKHFVANEQETFRLTIDSVVQERPLRELYLRPFEMAIREANPWAVMSSYNLINGVHADCNFHTLREILREEWSYDGLVMSDWGGTNSIVESIEAGCDIEMPVSTKWRGAKAIEAVKNGELSREAVEKAAANVLYLVERTKGSDMTPEAPEAEDDREETRRLIRRAGVEGLTLLKNKDNILPIKSSQTKVAVIGPNANRAIAGGGGSASLNPYYNTIPLDSIKAIPGIDVTYALGCHTYKWLPLAADYCTTSTGAQGVTLEFHIGDKFEGAPRIIQHRTNTDLFLWDSVPEEVNPIWSVRAKNHTDTYHHGLTHPLLLKCRSWKTSCKWRCQSRFVELDGSGEAMFSGSKDILFDIFLEANVPVQLVAETTNEIRPLSKQAQVNQTHATGGCRIGYKEADAENYLQKAIDAAKSSDVAIVIVGLDAEWESEGYDRQTMDLPSDGSQDRLIDAIVDANPNTIVVNQSGSPVTMPWAKKVPAILQAWYQGQEAGNALADVLFGFENPSGKLPTTFPVRLSDNPTYHTWPGENLRSLYGEGLYIGYRHYDHLSLPPLFPFGHGLSYTTFSYSAPTLSSQTFSSSNQDRITLSLNIKNTGPRKGKEIVQLYIHDVKSSLVRPEKELKGFAKVELEAGEEKSVDIVIDKYALGYWDESLRNGKGLWIAEEGEFEAWVGASAEDIRQKTSFEVKESFTWIF